MNPLEKIKNELPELTKSELQIANYILKNPIQLIRLSLTDIAKASKTSNTVIIRFCQKLGYQGFSEFKFAMSRYVLSEGSQLVAENTSHLTSITNKYIQYLNMMAASANTDDIKKVAGLVTNARNLVIMGYNRTGFSAQQLSYRLSKIGVANYLITDRVIMKDYMEILKPGDLCIIFSITTDGYKEIASRLHEHGCDLALFTMTPRNSIHKYATVMIPFPRISLSDEIGFLDDQALFFIFIEVLLSEVAEKLN